MTDPFYCRNEVLVADDRKGKEQVEGHNDVDDDGSIFPLCFGEQVFWKIVYRWRCAVLGETVVVQAYQNKKGLYLDEVVITLPVPVAARSNA